MPLPYQLSSIRCSDGNVTTVTHGSASDVVFLQEVIRDAPTSKSTGVLGNISEAHANISAFGQIAVLYRSGPRRRNT